MSFDIGHTREDPLLETLRSHHESGRDADHGNQDDGGANQDFGTPSPVPPTVTAVPSITTAAVSVRRRRPNVADLVENSFDAGTTALAPGAQVLAVVVEDPVTFPRAPELLVGFAVVEDLVAHTGAAPRREISSEIQVHDVVERIA